MPPSPEQIRTVINSSLRIRWILIFSWIFSLQGLLFALLPFLVNDAPTGMAIVVFNTSTLGLSAYKSPLSTNKLHHSINDLVPRHIVNPLSITQYLGVYDWYSVSYMWRCKGSYEIEKGFFTRMKDPECERQNLSNNKDFSLRELLEKDLNLSVLQLANEISDTKYRPSIWASLWLSGSCCGAFIFLFLPWTFRREKLLGTKNWCLIPTFLALVAFSIFLTTLCVIERQVTSNRGFKATIGSKFKTVSILCVVCMLMTFLVGSLGWGGGVWLQDSLPIKHSEEGELGEAEQYSDRPEVRTDELEELEPRPIDDNELPLENFEGAHRSGLPDEEFEGDNQRGLPEDASTQPSLLETPRDSELERISPQPIPDDESPVWQRSQFEKKLAAHRRMQKEARSV